MNNTVLKILAALLAIGALAVAILGIRLSQQSPAPAPAVKATAPALVEVVVAARTVRAGQPLGSADVVIKAVAAPPPQAFKQAQELLGKMPLANIVVGTPLEPAQFASDTLASVLHQDERAVAIQVDEIIGLGGLAKPGDHVDVLSYVQANRETRNNSFAQIAIKNARVLAFGDATQMDVDAAKRANPESSESQAASPTPKPATDVQERRRLLRSAVLAVAEADVTKLMLAASSGSVRLALRPQAPPPGSAAALAAAKSGENSQTITLSKIAPTGYEAVNAVSINDGAGSGRSVVIQEGSKERRLTTNEPPNQP